MEIAFADAFDKEKFVVVSANHNSDCAHKTNFIEASAKEIEKLKKQNRCDVVCEGDFLTAVIALAGRFGLHFEKFWYTLRKSDRQLYCSRQQILSKALHCSR